MKLDNVNVSCIKCIGYYVTQVANVTGLVYPRNSSHFLSNIYDWTSVLPKELWWFSLPQHSTYYFVLQKLILFQLLVFFNTLK